MKMADEHRFRVLSRATRLGPENHLHEDSSCSCSEWLDACWVETQSASPSAIVREALPSNGAANALIGLPTSPVAAPPQPRHCAGLRWNGDGAAVLH